MANHALPTSARNWWADLLRRLAQLIEAPRPPAAPDPQDAAWGAAIRKMATRMQPYYREQGYTA